MRIVLLKTRWGSREFAVVRLPCEWSVDQEPATIRHEGRHEEQESAHADRRVLPASSVKGDGDRHDHSRTRRGQRGQHRCRSSVYPEVMGRQESNEGVKSSSISVSTISAWTVGRPRAPELHSYPQGRATTYAPLLRTGVRIANPRQGGPSTTSRTVSTLRPPVRTFEVVQFCRRTARGQFSGTRPTRRSGKTQEISPPPRIRWSTNSLAE